MSFRISDKVVISFPEGAQFQAKDSAGKNCYAADLNGKQGVITQGNVINREMHYTVEIEGFPPIKLFERDLLRPGLSREDATAWESVGVSQQQVILNQVKADDPELEKLDS